VSRVDRARTTGRLHPSGCIVIRTFSPLRLGRSCKRRLNRMDLPCSSRLLARLLTEAEIDKLLAVAGDSRNPGRDRLLILMAFRHALRVSELVDIRWQQVHLDTATIDIRRAKNGTPGIHGLQGDELRLLRALRREHPHADFVFLSERKAPLSVDGAQKLIERLGEAAELPFPIHAHMRGMLLATPWRLAESTQERCRPSWAIARSRTPLSTPRWLTSGYATSGASEQRLVTEFRSRWIA